MCDNLIQELRFVKNIIKFLLGAFFFYSGLFHLIRFLNNFFGRRLTILTFHRVANNDGKFQIKGLPSISISVNNFNSLIKFLKKHYHILSAEEYLNSVQNRTKFPRNSMMLTFDDGYKEVLEYALPLLKKYKLPAILFVPTRVIDEEGYFWWDVLYLLCSYSQNIQFNKEHPIEPSISNHLKRLEQISSKSSQHRDRAIYEFIETLHKSPEELRSKIVQYILDTYRNLECNQNAIPTVLKWKDIKVLQAAGIEIGSHTMTHRFLSTVAEQQVMDDLVGSKKKLEKILHNKIRCFAYPGGRYNDKIVEMVEAAGYTCAFTTNPGVNSIDENPYQLKRINIWDGTVTKANGKFSKALTTWHLFTER